MNNVSVNTQTRLRWHCRRGMLELDILLNTFLDEAYQDLSDDEQTRFKGILDYPDQTLFDLLLGKMQSSDLHVNRLVRKINTNLTGVV